MGSEKHHSPVLLVCGILAANDNLASEIISILEAKWGTTVSISSRIPFDFTKYYDKEMGEGILRFYMGFDNLVEAGKIGDIKRQSNLIEKNFTIDGKRQVNIDPGYITLAKLVLATTKDATHRIYLGNGIFAESTLFFKSGTFYPWQWTYPDYRHDNTIQYFNTLREIYRQKLQSVK